MSVWWDECVVGAVGHFAVQTHFIAGALQLQQQQQQQQLSGAWATPCFSS
jgi:hypothetical protein